MATRRLVLAIFLVGCGGKEAADSGGDTATSGVPTTSPTSPTTTPSTSPTTPPTTPPTTSPTTPVTTSTGCPTASVVSAVPGAEVFVETDIDRPWEQAVLRSRAVDVSGGAGTTVTFTGSGLTVYDASGTEVSFPYSMSGDETWYVRSNRPGTALMSFEEPAGCGTPIDAVAFRSAPATGVTGRVLAAYPHFEFVSAFNHDEVLETAIDPGRHADRVGLDFDLYIVEDRTAAQWAADGTLVDVRGSSDAEAVVGGSIIDNALMAWAGPLAVGPELVTGYDVVYDFGRDGTLDPGDLVDGLDGPGFGGVIPLIAEGTHDTHTFEFSADYWNTQRIYVPADIGSMGKLPLVVISHGNGHHYTWYDYLGEHLASWGYVVMSHRNNTVPGPVTAAVTTITNTDVFLAMHPSMEGGLLDGHIDQDQIAWVGHSRGGEGVVLAYHDMVRGAAHTSVLEAENVVLVSSIAPTLFETPDDADPHDVVYHQMNGSRDGDVTGAPSNSIVQYFRIFQRGDGDHLVTYVQGADHNDFNCCGAEDGAWASGPGETIGRESAQRVAKSYFLAMFDHYIRGDEILGEYLWRNPESFRPDTVDAVLSNLHMPAAAVDKLVIDDFQSEFAADMASSGGAVSTNAESPAEDELDDSNGTLAWDGDAMNGMTWSHGDPDGERGAVLSFGADAYWQVAIPAAGRDWSAGRYLSFRSAQGTRHPYTVSLGDSLHFSATLVDGAGNESSIDFGVYGGIAQPYARTDGSAGTGWVNEFNTTRIPLEAFQRDGTPLDLSDIAFLRFDFGPSHGSDQGRVGFDDIEVLF
jgi:hypothetical protein